MLLMLIDTLSYFDIIMNHPVMRKSTGINFRIHFIKLIAEFM